MRGNDVFITLPNGIGKGLCYGLLRSMLDALYWCETGSIGIVVLSPLVALTKDQVIERCWREARGLCTWEMWTGMKILQKFAKATTNKSRVIGDKTYTAWL